MPEKFDFSKIEDQKNFDKLPKEEQGQIIDEAQEDAEQIKKRSEWSQEKRGIDYEIGNQQYDKENVGLNKTQITDKNKINELIETGKIDEAYEIFKDYSGPIESIKEILRFHITDALKRNARSDLVIKIIEVIKTFALPIDEEIKDFGFSAFKKQIKKGNIENAFEIVEKLNLSSNPIYKSFMSDIIHNILCKHETRYWKEDIVKIQKYYPLSDDDISNIIKYGVEFKHSSGDVLGLKNLLKDKKGVPAKEIEIFVKDKINQFLCAGETYKALGLFEQTNYDNNLFFEEKTRNAIIKGFIFKLNQGEYSDVVKIKNKFELSSEEINQPEVKEAIKKCLINLLEKDRVEDIFLLCKEFSLPDDIFLDEAVQTSIFKVKESGLEFISNGITEKELAPEILDKIMMKVQDLNKNGIAYTCVGQSLKDPFKKSISEELSEKFFEKFKNFLNEGLLGTKLYPIGGRPNANDEYYKEKSINRKEAWKKNIRDYKQGSEVYFNITGRAIDIMIERRLNELIREKLGIAKNTTQEIGYGGYAHLGTIILTFDLSHFTEVLPASRWEQQKSRTFGIAEVRWKGEEKDAILSDKLRQKIYEENKTDVEEEYNIKTEPSQYPISESGEGFLLHYRVAPRFFNGIIVTDMQGNLWKQKISGEFLENVLKNLVSSMKEAYKGKENLMIPIYDTRGNLLWPKQMSHEEIKKLNKNQDSI